MNPPREVSLVLDDFPVFCSQQSDSKDQDQESYRSSCAFPSPPSPPNGFGNQKQCAAVAVDIRPPLPPPPPPHVTEQSSSFSSENIGRHCFQSGCSLMAFMAGMAAFACALGAIIGTAWVDTWEPIYLSRSDDWSVLFGTGYGTLTHELASLNDRQKMINAPVESTTFRHPSNGTSYEPSPTPLPTVTQSSVRSLPPFHVITANESRNLEPIHRTTKPDEDDDAEYDDEDYYAQDEGFSIHSSTRMYEDDAEQVMIVLFHVGLWRACPLLLGGQLPSTVG